MVWDSLGVKGVIDMCGYVVGDADPINCLAVSIASCLLSSLVITTVHVAVVGVGLTTLLNVDNFPRLGILIGVTVSVVVIGNE